MLKKIDCVMIRVDDVETAARYYSDVFGLRRLWRDETLVGMGFAAPLAEYVFNPMLDYNGVWAGTARRIIGASQAVAPA